MIRQIQTLQFPLLVILSVILCLGVFPYASIAEDENTVDLEDFHKSLNKEMEQYSREMEKFSKEMEKMSQELQQHFHKQFKNMDHKVLKNVQKALKNLQHLENLDHLEHLKNLSSQIDIQIPPIPDIPSLPNIPPIPKIEFHVPDMNFDGKGRYEDFEGEIVSETIQKTFSAGEDLELDIEAEFGSIQVLRATGEAKVDVKVITKAGADTIERAQELLDEFEVSVEKEGNTVKVVEKILKDDEKEKERKKRKEEKKEKKEKTMQQCDIKVIAPAGAPIRIVNTFGDVVIDEMKSPVDCKNTFGSTTVIGSNDTIRLKTEYGAARVINHTGSGLLKSEFGSLMVDGWSGDMDVKAGYGKSEIKGLAPDANVNGNFSFGKVNLTIPADFTGLVEASSSFGKIEAPDDFQKKKAMMAESVRGAMGEGRGKIRISSSYAPVIIAVEK